MGDHDIGGNKGADAIRGQTPEDQADDEAKMKTGRTGCDEAREQGRTRRRRRSNAMNGRRSGMPRRTGRERGSWYEANQAAELTLSPCWFKSGY